MNEEIQQLKRELGELKAWRVSLEHSSDIPFSVDKALRERFNLPIVRKFTLNFPDTSTQDTSELTVNIPEASVGDFVSVAPSAGSVVDITHYFAYISTTGVVTIRFVNPDTVSSFNPGSEIFTVIVIKP